MMLDTRQEEVRITKSELDLRNYVYDQVDYLIEGIVGSSQQKDSSKRDKILFNINCSVNGDLAGFIRDHPGLLANLITAIYVRQGNTINNSDISLKVRRVINNTPICYEFIIRINELGSLCLELLQYGSSFGKRTT